MCAGVKPRVAALHDLYVKLVLLQVSVVYGCNFKLTAGAGFDCFGYAADLIVIKVQTSNGVVAFGLGGLFFNAAGFAAGVKRHHAVTLRVGDVVRKDCGACSGLVSASQQLNKVMTMKNVVTQHQGAGVLADKLLTNDESLCQAVRAGLHGV